LDAFRVGGPDGPDFLDASPPGVYSCFALAWRCSGLSFAERARVSLSGFGSIKSEESSRMNKFGIHLRNGANIPLVKSVPFVAIHLAALAVLFVEFRWVYVLLCVVLYATGMFFVTAGYHRYFSHRSFKTSRVFQFILAFLAMTSSQKGVLWWAAHHRHHHRFSDTDEDLHSPTKFGFWWAHVGWILSDRYDHTEVDLIRDFYKFPELPALN